MDDTRALLPIPIQAARRVAEEFGYDQVVIIARRIGEGARPHGEHCTTYGIDKANCEVAARMGDFFKHKLMGWKPEPASTEIAELRTECAALRALIHEIWNAQADGEQVRIDAAWEAARLAVEGER